MKKVAVIGSTTFPLTASLGTEIVNTLRSFGECVILTRGAGEFERFIAVAAIALGLRCFAMPGQGGSLNFVRDAELVEACDEMVAFIDPAALDAPHRGTAMVIERALTAGKRVRAATSVEGNLVWADS